MTTLNHCHVFYIYIYFKLKHTVNVLFSISCMKSNIPAVALVPGCFYKASHIYISHVTFSCIEFVHFIMFFPTLSTYGGVVFFRFFKNTDLTKSPEMWTLSEETWNCFILNEFQIKYFNKTLHVYFAVNVFVVYLLWGNIWIKICSKQVNPKGTCWRGSTDETIKIKSCWYINMF